MPYQSDRQLGSVSSLALVLAVVVGALVGACNGCRGGRGKGDGSSIVTDGGLPTVRIYVVSDLAGALEPCGCQKDMLGGVDHFAALVAKERERAPSSATIAAGPLFFMQETLKPERVEQDTWKAEAIAVALRNVALAAFAPGKNDWSDGDAELTKLKDASGAALVAANLAGVASAGAIPYTTREVGGVKVAFVGVSDLKSQKGAPQGLTIDDPGTALATTARKARADGAKIVVGIAAMERGAAIRAAEKAQDLDLLAIGSGALDGEENSRPQPPRFVGAVLVVQPSNHLTRVSIVDFHLRGGRGEGRFADGSGLTRAEEVTNLVEQIDTLEKRIANWERDPSVSKTDLEARRKDLQTLRDKLARADQPPPAPTGNFLRYALADIRDSLGKEPTATRAMTAYYHRVNDFNKTKFAGLRAPPPEKGAPFYVGVQTCKACHASSFDVWTNTPHGHAYKTLADASKEFNFDCVECHVTGYQKPGGSTITDVADLKDVQCEQCHGPGSDHIKDPSSYPLPDGKDDQICASCHHPPHTDIFDFPVRLPKILGPGHGLPGAPANNDPPKSWKPPKTRF